MGLDDYRLKIVVNYYLRSARNAEEWERYREFSQDEGYGLRHFARDLCELGLHEELFEHVTSRQWFDAQAAFDPSRQTYVDSVDWALRAAESDPGGLAALLVLTLLRPTAVELTTQVPLASLEVLARLGEIERAESYAEMRGDGLSRSEALCRIAQVRHEQGDVTGARKTLQRARREVEYSTGSVGKAQTLCTIARALGSWGDEEEARAVLDEAERTARHSAPQETDKRDDYLALLSGENRRMRLAAQLALAAHDVGGVDARQRTARAVRNAYHGKWEDVGEAHNVFERPRLLSLLVEGASLGPAMAQVAVLDDDRALLDALLAHAYRVHEKYPFDLASGDTEAIVEALGEEGLVDDALAFVRVLRRAGSWRGTELRAALARGAGRRGDLETIQLAIAANYGQPANTDMGGWARLRDVAWTVKDRLVRRGKRLVGLGDLEDLDVLAAGIEGLRADHQEEVRVLWDRVAGQGGWLWKWALPLLKEWHTEPIVLIGRVLPGSARGLIGFAVRLLRLAALWDEDADDLMASLNQLEDAMAADPESVRRVAETLVGFGENDRALDLLKIAHDPRLVAEAAEALTGRPHEEGIARLNLTVEANRLDEDQELCRQEAWAVLMRETAQHSSIPEAMQMSAVLGPSAVENALAELAEAAGSQRDLEWGKQLLRKARKQDQVANLVLARMAACWAEVAAEEEDKNLARAWSKLAAQAYRPALSRAKKLVPGLQKTFSPWPLLARAARHLGDRNALTDLAKEAARLRETQNVVNRALADAILVQVAIGLSSPYEFVAHETRGEIRYLEYRAQLLAERAAIMRDLEPRKLLFWTRQSQHGLERDAEFMLDRVVRELAEGLGVSQRSILSRGLKAAFRSDLSSTDRARLDKLGGEAMESIFEALVRAGRQGDVLNILQHSRGRDALYQVLPTLAIRRARFTTARRVAPTGRARIVQDSSPDPPPALLAAAKVLARHGHTSEAQQLLMPFEKMPEAAPAVAALAQGLAETEPGRAEELLENLLPIGILAEEPAVLTAIAEAANALPVEARWRIACRGFRAARVVGRESTVRALGAFAPVVASLTDAQQWKAAMAKLIETETWYRYQEAQ